MATQQESRTRVSMVDVPVASPGHPSLSAPADAIVCTGVTKDYGEHHGVFDLDLTVHTGEVFGFIGTNGAGKTTTLRLIMDLIRPDHGSINVFGHDVRREGSTVRGWIGYLPGELPQWPGVTAAHVLGLLAGLRGGVEEAWLAGLIDRLRLDVHRPYRELSHGNKQKVGLVAAFMHRPDLLILDEPTLGLDPLMQREVRALIAEAVAAGATCLLSSHVLAEVEVVCDRIGLIRDGRMVRVGTLADLRELRAHRVTAIIPDQPMPADFAAVPGVEEVSVHRDTYACTVRGDITPLLGWLARHGAIELDSRELTLEEVFLAQFRSR